MKSSKLFLFSSLILAITIHIMLLSAFFFLLLYTPSIKSIHPVHEKRLALSLTNSLLSQPVITALVHPVKYRMIRINNPQNKSFISSAQQNDTNMTSVLQSNEDMKKLTRDDIKFLPRSILHHYGDEFFELSASEQHYLLDNLQKIRKINDLVGNRLLQGKPDEEIDTKENNIVEFYLHPDGSISDLTLSKERERSMLDELTLETIELAHTQYPKPKQTTLIRIRVWILVK